MASNMLLTCRKWVRFPPGPQRWIPSQTDNLDIRNGVENLGSSPSPSTNKCPRNRVCLLSS